MTSCLEASQWCPQERWPLLGELLLATDQSLDSFCEQNRIERLAERFIQNGPIETTCVVVVGQESDLNNIVVFRILAKVLCNHQGFAAAHSEVDDDTIRVE